MFPIFVVIADVFWRFFSGYFREPFWNPKMERQNGWDAVGGGQEAAECGQDAAEFGSSQEFPPLYRFLAEIFAGCAAEKDLRRPWQPA